MAARLQLRRDLAVRRPAGVSPRHFEALQSLKVDVIKQQRLEEATFIVRSKALLK
jgi:hypothetical protein